MFLKRKVFLSIMIGILFIAGGCTSKNEDKVTIQENKQKTKALVPFKIVSAKNQKVGQIRGLGYPGNDHALYVATNDGMKFYMNPKWLETTKNKHNYMSMQALDTGFMASGHPQKGLGIQDPLGIMESLDKGKSFKELAFYGKSNFHFLSASFSGNEIYIINEQSNNNLDQGLYYSKNGGNSWAKCKLTNFTADSLGMVAVQPNNGNIMAMATKTGIFYSEDYGNTMKAITGPEMITALSFIGDEILYSSAEENKILLKKINPKTGEMTDVIFPFLDYNNPVTYIAVNPKNEKEISFSTYKDDLYQSLDGGKSWTNLLAEGRIEQD